MGNQVNFKKITIIYGALIAGVSFFLFFAVTLFGISDFNTNDKTIFSYLVPTGLIIAFLLSGFFYKKGVNNIDESDELSLKITKYLTINILRAAPLEAAGILSIAASFMTSNKYYLLFAILAILLMVFYFPTKNRFMQDVNLTFDDKSKLNEL